MVLRRKARGAYQRGGVAFSPFADFSFDRRHKTTGDADGALTQSEAECSAHRTRKGYQQDEPKRHPAGFLPSRRYGPGRVLFNGGRFWRQTLRQSQQGARIDEFRFHLTPIGSARMREGVGLSPRRPALQVE